MLIRIAGIVEDSVVDGPGLRYTIFVQGCPHCCVGCHNPQTHDSGGGYETTTDELLKAILKQKLISGITISGGEPFMQAAACAKLAQEVKKAGTLNIVIYSGYYHKDLIVMAKNDPDVAALLDACDILIDGPYEADKKSLNLPFRGSSNQSIIRLS
jgi:anaerobic ribonucleoside-triphosphate reductase activating protein